MKLKYNFVVRNVGGKCMAVAVGEDNARFNGMIKMNATGEFIFTMLKNNTTLEKIAQAVVEKFGVDENQAKTDAEKFIDTLKKSGIIEE